MKKTITYYFDEQEYDYELEVSVSDIIAYVKPDDYKTYSPEKKEGFRVAIAELLNNWMFEDFIDNDSHFNEWLKDRYEEKAYEEFWEMKNSGEGE